MLIADWSFLLEMLIKMHAMYLLLTKNPVLRSVKISYPLHIVIYNEAEELRGSWSNLHLVASVFAKAWTPTVNIKCNTSGIISIKAAFTIIIICSYFCSDGKWNMGLITNCPLVIFPPLCLFIISLQGEIYSNLHGNKEPNLYYTEEASNKPN